MFPAQVVAFESGGSAIKLFGEWEDRRAASCLVSLEVGAMNNAWVKYRMYTKNREDEGDGDPVGPTIQILEGESSDTVTNPATEGKFDGNLKELVRDYFEVLDNGSGSGFAIVRVLPKVWYDAVKA